MENLEEHDVVIGWGDGWNYVEEFHALKQTTRSLHVTSDSFSRNPTTCYICRKKKIFGALVEEDGSFVLTSFKTYIMGECDEAGDWLSTLDSIASSRMQLTDLFIVGQPTFDLVKGYFPTIRIALDTHKYPSDKCHKCYVQNCSIRKAQRSLQRNYILFEIQHS